MSHPVYKGHIVLSLIIVIIDIVCQRQREAVSQGHCAHGDQDPADISEIYLPAQRRLLVTTIGDRRLLSHAVVKHPIRGILGPLVRICRR